LSSFIIALITAAVYIGGQFISVLFKDAVNFQDHVLSVIDE